MKRERMVLYHHRDTEDTENKKLEMQLICALSTVAINLIPAFLLCVLCASVINLIPAFPLCVLCASVVKVTKPARDEGDGYAST